MLNSKKFMSASLVIEITAIFDGLRYEECLAIATKTMTISQSSSRTGPSPPKNYFPKANCEKSISAALCRVGEL
jgi:hypothetical protein